MWKILSEGEMGNMYEGQDVVHTGWPVSIHNAKDMRDISAVYAEYTRRYVIKQNTEWKKPPKPFEQRKKDDWWATKYVTPSALSQGAKMTSKTVVMTSSAVFL